jgi:hypothetical protein
MPISPPAEVVTKDDEIKDTKEVVDVDELVEELKDGEEDDPAVSPFSIASKCQRKTRRECVCMPGWSGWAE